MTVDQHSALGQPGEAHLGSELDCPKCRTELLKAFRAPPEAPDPHSVVFWTEPSHTTPGGVWTARCSCGWTRSGTYARSGVGRTVAERLARIQAERHQANPLEGTEDE